MIASGGFRQGIITSGLNHLAHLASTEIDEWKIQRMRIRRREQMNSSCVASSGVMARDALGSPLSNDEATKFEMVARKNNGIANHPKFFKSMGMDTISFDYQNDGTWNSWYNENGISDGMKCDAIKFIVENMQKGHPVLVAFKSDETEAHMAVISEIKYKADYSAFEYIELTDPSSVKINGNTIYYMP